MPRTIPAKDWDRMAAVAEFFGGVGSNITYDTPDQLSGAPVCIVGVAHAAGVINPATHPSPLLDEGRRYFGVHFTVFDAAIKAERKARGLPHEAQCALWQDLPRVPFDAVMRRAGFQRAGA
jgi:hypothetical protein